MKTSNIDWQVLTTLPGSKDIGRKKFKILDAAIEVVANDGVQALGVTKISKASGLSKSLILYHYKDMNLLMADLFFYSAKIGRFYIEKNLEKANSFEEKIAQMTLSLFEWICRHQEIGEFFILMFHEAGKTPELSAVQQQTIKNSREIWERIFFESMRYQNIEQLRTDLTGIESLINGNLLMMISLQETQSPNNYLKALKENIEKILEIELPELKLEGL